ncbi:uncharacterized protein [Diadema antillarum]|uniref:uncharacterized protein n=1 Tax=Diadema antillarum TaxID=105358 RepID=UPI003A8B693F
MAASAELYIANLDPGKESGIIESTLRGIREKIHTSKSFYKDFLVKFHLSDGMNNLLEILRSRLDEETVVDLSISVLATCCLDKSNAQQVKELDGIATIAATLRQYTNSSISIVNRCARSLANLIKTANVDEQLRKEEDILPLLVQALDDIDDGGCCHSLLRVLKMIAGREDRTLLWEVVDCGGLRSVCKKFTSSDSKLVLMAVETAVALTAPFNRCKSRCRLSLPIAAANPVLENNHLTNLFDLLSHHRQDIQHHAWECIGNLMSSDIGRAALGNAGFVKFFKATALNHSIKTSVREQCAHYLCLCCQESVNRAKMCEMDGLRFLVDLLDDTELRPGVPVSLVIAAIAEFRFDTAAMEQFAALNLVKLLISCLAKKVKAQHLENEEGNTSDEESQRLELKGKRKRTRKQRSKRRRKDDESKDCAPLGKTDSEMNPPFSPMQVPQGHPVNVDGLSPQHQFQWCPESPRMSPGSHSNTSGMCMSPPRQIAFGMSPEKDSGSGRLSPAQVRPPAYQFPSSMMSPPKSDSASPCSSPTHSYSPSSPQKFYYGEEVFSPIVSEASDSESSVEDSCESLNDSDCARCEEKEGDSKQSMDSVTHGHNESLLEQARRKLTLGEESDVGERSKSNSSITPQDLGEMSPSLSVRGPKASREDHPALTISRDGADNVELESHSANKSQSSKAVDSAASTASSLSTPSSSRRPGMISLVPRTSLGSITDETDRERRPSGGRRVREEEENIILILQEMILLHHVPAIMCVTSLHSIQTLLHHVMNGSVAIRETHRLLRDILSSRLFFDKLVLHGIPYLIFRSQTADEKLYKGATTSGNQKGRRASRSASCDEESYPCSKARQYLMLLREIAGTSFGQKEVEHILLGQLEEDKLQAAISIPYLYSAKSVLRYLLINCGALHYLLEQCSKATSGKTVRQVGESLSHASSMLLPPWEHHCDKHFLTGDTSLRGVAASQESLDDGGMSDSDTEECLYQADGYPSDVSLICEGGETVRANRQVLAARSEYFACLLMGNFQEAAQDVITLTNVCARSMTYILHGLYDCHPFRCRTLRALSGEGIGGLLDVLSTAKYCMTLRDSSCPQEVRFCPLVQRATGILLRSRLDESTAFQLADYAACHNFSLFLDSCLLFICQLPKHVGRKLRRLLVTDSGDQIANSLTELFKKSTLLP